MQKIFIVKEDKYEDDEDGNFSRVNDFMGDTGFVVSVTPQYVSRGGGTGGAERGRWLVVADDGQGSGEDKLLP